MLRCEYVSPKIHVSYKFYFAMITVYIGHV